MKLHNTLTKQTETLKPLVGNEVRMYTCGPTVYDYLQIGNWLTIIRCDILARTLRVSGFELNWIMNITDVGHLVSDADEGEDKLEKGASREGKTAWEVAEFYTQDFRKGVDALNISIPRDHLPKATDHIPEQIALVQKLEEKGLTYIIDDGVYFDTAKLPDYGKLVGPSSEDAVVRARVEANPQKHHTADFALWKFSPKDKARDMEWDSPWGKGFPGWHLECSAMAMKYLGETLDIHAGGIDLIPVHHTNEIAQSESATGKPFANIWVHSNFLTVDGTKLSKSLQNSYTLADLLQHGFTAMDYRMFALQSHYRTQTNFSWDNLTAAKNALKKLRTFADLRWHQSNITDQSFLTKELVGAKEKVLKHLQNDLSTPMALAELYDIVSELENTAVGQPDIPLLEDFLRFLDDVFGLELLASTDLSLDQKSLLGARGAARETKDWAKSDELRDQLKAQGVGVRDTDNGQIWYRL